MKSENEHDREVEGKKDKKKKGVEEGKTSKCGRCRELFFFFLSIRQPPRSTQSRSSAASDVYKRQVL